MANAEKVKAKKRLRKSRGVRKNVRGSADKPRLSVFRSGKYIYCQAIDDESGNTLAAASQLEKDVRAQTDSMKKSEAAKVVGTLLAERLKDKNIGSAVFDRGWYKYHGRVKALADAVRAGGVKF